MADSSPAESAFAVTTSDTVNLASTARALYIGVTGDVTLIPADTDTAVLFKAVPIGILPVRARRVNATGTTATNIVALY